MLSIVLLPIAAYAQPTGKAVRVGWFESPFNMMDAHGRRSGYAYEYQRKIAAYTGWEFEYIEGSWPELFQMLLDGELDLMSDVSYTPERAERMLFSNLPMGAEEYYIFVSPNNEVIRQDDPHTLNGKKIGVNKGSIQIGFYHEWAEYRSCDRSHKLSLVLPHILRRNVDSGQEQRHICHLLIDSGNAAQRVSIPLHGGEQRRFRVLEHCHAHREPQARHHRTALQRNRDGRPDSHLQSDRHQRGELSVVLPEAGRNDMDQGIK
ncbi:MAG: transporter substrate-binding domain-containing protein [Clostridia bacterium]|nr:transporter substrate-binding domain-containing protein [Clostridia bacterium]